MKISHRIVTLVICMIGSFSMSQAQVFWSEDFGTGCSQNNVANSTPTANGTWTVNTTVGPNDAFANEFFISATEAGMGAGNCGDGCLANAALTNRSLHIGSVAGSPAGGLFCPSGDCGAAYDASVASARRAESPVIDCTGESGISVDFNYMMFGEQGADEASLWYFDGVAWTNISNAGNALSQTVCCGGTPCGGFAAQGQWQNLSINLPASADNNPNVQLGFQWINNNNNSGSDPSFAVDDVQLSSTTSNPLPVADFTISNTTLCEGDCINFTDVSTGSPTSWNWTFTGAATPASTNQNPTNICYNTAGTYDVTLSVSNANGTDDTTMTAVITVTTCGNAPTANFTASNTNICENDCINFTDLSAGGVTSWNWSFPGATPNNSTNQNPSNICYATAGTYDVMLTVSNASGTDDTTITGYITVTTCGSAPTANFSASNTTLCSGDCIDFTDMTTGGATAWSWSFPGATPSSSTSQNPTGICYNTPGTYDVTLSATNNFGSDDVTMTGFITVTACTPPSASFSPSSTGGCEGDCFDFTDNSVDASSWSWSFPGGSPATSTDQNPSNICFAAAGSYDVELTVSNGSGTDTYTQTITIGTPAILDAGIDQTIGLGDSVTLSVTGGSGNCTWFPSDNVACPTCPTTGALPLVSTLYTVTCVDSLGCVSSATVNITVEGEEAVGVPTAFSPNGNGANDKLYVEGQGVANMRFVVYNRYGQKVWETISMNEGWDGTFKGKPLNPATFAWYLEVEYFSGTIERLKGNVTLVR